MSSRLIVEGERPRRSAIERRDRPDASPREISSRSTSVSERLERRRAGGRIPPVHYTRFAHFSDYIGLAFQIRDDILDIQVDTLTLGKPQGSDAAQNKPTYPSIVGIEAAEKTANDLLQQALHEIKDLNSAGDTLRAVSNYMVVRNS